MVPGALQTVLTNGPAGDQPGIYYNLGTKDSVWITQISYGVLSTSDDCEFEFGSTDAANGGGTFTPRTCGRHAATGAANQGKLDADTNTNTMMAYGIMGIPTLILFKDGEAVERITGFMPKDKLLARLQPHLGAVQN